MTEECKYWVKELSGSTLSVSLLGDSHYEINTIAILVKAMWKLEGKDFNTEIKKLKIKLQHRFDNKDK